MSDNAEQRKLAAIMFTDMVGYSAMAQRDDQLALELLEEHRRVLREIFPRFHGTEIKTIGDAFLVEFGSALEAAQCGIEIQRTLAKRNPDMTADRRIQLRIGIHIGDVVHREGDVYGDGVNIASRIEQLAGPGGICVSMDVERQIRNALEARFEKFGSADLKNIKLPMELFRIVLPWETGAPIERAETPIGKKSLLPAVIAAVVFIGLVSGWWLMQHSGRNRNSATQSGNALPGEPAPAKSIAVLPFDNLSRDPDNAYFAEGIQDEVLTRLAKIADLKVISRTSTQKYKSSPDNLREIGKQLGVATILEGSVQKIANAVHVNVQLIRAATDEHVWAESYNRTLDDVFAVEGEVATAIADQLNAKLTGAERKAVNDKPTQNPAAYDAYLRGVVVEQTRTDDAAQTDALACYSTAIRLDPKFALAWARLAILRSIRFFDGVDPANNTPAAVKQAADQALSVQPQLGEAFVAQGVYRYRVLRDFGGALESYGEALKRLPNSSLVFNQMAHVERRLGLWDAAEKHYRAAAALDPQDLDTLTNLSDFLGTVRKTSEKLSILDRILEISPGNESALVSKAVAFQLQGNLDEAQRQLDQIKPNSPNVFVNVIRTFQLQFERKFDEAIAFIQSNPNREFTDDPRTIVNLGLCQESAGRKEDARATFTRAVAAIKPRPDAVVPVDSRLLSSFLAWAYAGLGENDKALEQAKRAVTEYKDDLLSKPFAEQVLANIQARVGDIDSAIAALPHLLEMPDGLTRGQLHIDPLWDPLRKDPRFAQLIAEPAETK